MSSSWCYRLVRHSEDGSLGLYEISTSDTGHIIDKTEEPLIVGDDLNEINECLSMAHEALIAPILDEEDVFEEMSRAPLDLDDTLAD